jgi:hypothetical protein
MNQYQINYIKAQAKAEATADRYTNCNRTERQARFDDMDYIEAQSELENAKLALIEWGCSILNNLDGKTGTEIMNGIANGQLSGADLKKFVDNTMRLDA